MDLQGGWESFVRKKTASAPKVATKVDPDVAIMQSLYTSDGGLPQQYAAWTPPSADAPAPSPPPAAAGAAAGGSVDLTKAAADFEKDDDDDSGGAAFVQVGMMIRHAAAAAKAAGTAADTGLSSSRAEAANAVLEQYAEVLDSQPLHRLAAAHLGADKIVALSRSLEAVDPMKSSPKDAVHGENADQEKYCLNFLQNAEAVVSLPQAIALVEKSTDELSESTAKRAALAEEVAARTQLQKTMEQDVQSLSAMLAVVRKAQDMSKVESAESDLAAHAVQGAGKALGEFGEAAGELQAAHSELEDSLQSALEERQAVLAWQQGKLSELQKTTQDADKELDEKKEQVATSQSSMEAAKKKLAATETSCSTTLDALEHRRHASHMEARAIEAVRQVLGAQ